MGSLSFEIEVYNRNMYFVDPFDLLDFKFIAKNEKQVITVGNCEKINENILRINLETKSSNLVKWLDVEGHLIENQSWAEAGHVLISEQFELTASDVADLPISSMQNSGGIWQPFTLTQSLNQIVVEQESKRVLVVCKKSGQIISFCYALTNLETNYSRAVTDNDRGGADLLMGFVLPKFVVNTYGKLFGDKLFSYLHHWRKAGLTPGALESVVVSSLYIIIEFQEGTNHTFLLTIAFCKQNISYDSTTSGVLITIQNAKVFERKVVFREVITYTLSPNKLLRVSIKTSPNRKIMKKVPTLPRLGLSFGLINPDHGDGNNKNEAIVYCGRGPHENYIDRHVSALQGVYPYQFASHYIVPSECGNRTDVRWLNLLNRYVVQGDSNTFQFSVNAANQKAIDDALHTTDIPENTQLSSDRIYVNVDFKQMGVGGDCSWFPCVYDQFKIDPMKEYEYDFVFMPR